MEEKAPSHRRGCIQAILCALGGDEAEFNSIVVDKEVVTKRYLDDLEKIIKIGATDKDIEVRKLVKRAWEIFRREWSERVSS